MPLCHCGYCNDLEPSPPPVPLANRKLPLSSIPLPVLAWGERPSIPNVSGWLRKWQLLPHLECLLPRFQKCWKGRSDICSGALLTSPCLFSTCFPPCHPVFPALLCPWIYIRCSSARCPNHRAGFDIHNLLTGCSLIAAGVCLAPLLSHWQIRGKGPPAVPPRLLSALGAALLTQSGCDTQKNNLQGHSFSSFHFASFSVSARTLFPFVSRAETLYVGSQRWVNP